MAIATISNTGGLYSASSSWVGNFVPTSIDDVVSTITSGPLTVDVSSVARSLNFGPYTSTLTMNAGLTVSGNVTLGLTMSISGTHGIVVNSSATMSSNGLTWSNPLTFTGTNNNYTFFDDWSISGLIIFNGTTQTTLNGKIITASGGIRVSSTATILGTTGLRLTGGTWSHTSTGAIRNNLSIDGNCNFGTSIYYNTGTFSYLSGVVGVSGSTFYVGANTNFSGTNGFNFDSFYTTAAVTLNGSDINLLKNLTIGNTTTGTSKIVMKGTGVWSASGYLGNNIDFNAPGNTITLSGNIYYYTGTMSYIAGTVSASSATLNLFTGGNLGLSLGDSISFASIKTWGVTTTINLGNNLRTTDLWVGPYISGNWTSTFLTITGTYSTFVSGTFYFGLDQFNGNTVSPLYHSISISNTLSTNNFAVAYGDTNARGGNYNIINGGTLSVSGAWTNSNYSGQSNITGTGKIIMNGTSITTSNRILSVYTNLVINPQSNLSLSIAGSGLVFAGSNLEYSGGTVSWNNHYIQIGSSANITTNSTSKWYYLYFTGGTSTLVNDCNVDILGSGGTVVVNSNKFNVNSNLIINGAVSGTSEVLILGTGSQTWTSTSNLANNLTVNKPSGTFSISGTVYYSTGTFSYLSGAVSTNNGTFSMNGSCNLSTTGITWSNISNSATGNINLLNNLTWTGTWSATTGTITFTGSGVLSPTPTTRINFSGSSAVTTPDSVIGYTFSSINITTSGITTLRGNLLTSGLLTLGGSGNINSASGLTGSITTTGGLSMSGNCSGTSFISLNGGTWSASGANYLSNNLRLDGDSRVSGNVYYQTGTMSYLSGNVTTTNSTLNVSGTTTVLDTNGVTWSNLTFTNTTTRLTSNLNISGLLTNQTTAVTINSITSSLVKVYTNSLANNITTFGTSEIVLNPSVLGTWSHSSAVYLNNNLTLDGNVNITGNVYYKTGTMSYISGSVSTVGSSLTIGSSCTLNTNPISWNNFNVETSGTVLLNTPSNLNIGGTFRMSGLSGAITLSFTGPGLFNPSGPLSFGDFSVSGGPVLIQLNLPNDINVSSFYYYSGPATNRARSLEISGNRIVSISGSLTFDSGGGNGTLSGNSTLRAIGSGTIQCRNAAGPQYGPTLSPKLEIAASGTYNFTNFPYFINATILYTSGTVSGAGIGNPGYGAAFIFSNCTFDMNASGRYWGQTPTLTNQGFTLYTYLEGTSTLMSTASFTNLATTSGLQVNANVLISGTGSVNVGRNLQINRLTSGKPIIINGTGSQTWTGTSYLENNFTINKDSGTLSVSGNVYYQTGTMSYVSGTTSTTGSTLNIGGNANLQTNPIQWFNINNAAAATVNLINNLSFTGTWSAAAGVISYTGSGILSPTSSSRINFSGTSNVTVPDSVNGITMSSITLTTSGTTQLRGTISCSGLLTLGGSGAINNASGFTGFIRTGGGLSMAGNASGTATIVLVGGTWSASGANYLSNNLRLDGNSTISGNVYYQSGTLSYVSGVVSATNSTLNLGSSCVIDSSGITWSNITNTTTAAVTLPTDLLWVGTYSVTAGVISFTGSGSLSASTTGNINFSGSSTITLKNNIQVNNVNLGVTQINTNQMNINGNLSINSNFATGTTVFNITGTNNQTWSGAGILQNNININKSSGILTISPISYQTGTITYVSGETYAGNLFLNGAATLNTKGILWDAISGNIQLTLLSDLHCNTITGNGGNIVNSGGNLYLYKGLSNGIGQLGGTSTIYFVGAVTWNQTNTASNYCVANKIIIDTSETITFGSYVAYGNGGTLTYIRGKVNAKGSTFSIQLNNTTLINCHKINFDRVVIDGGQTVIMNQFFSGSPGLKTTLSSTTTTNYIISFTDNFEKVARYVNPTNLWVRPGQLLITTDGKKSFSTNRGIRYINSSPNGLSKNSNVIQPRLGTFLLNDPTMTKF